MTSPDTARSAPPQGTGPMGEAKRRALPYTATSAGEMLRQINEAYAKLSPAPINGADALHLSPGDFARVATLLEPSLTGVSTYLGLSICCNPLLIDGVFIGRRNGKTVWSNKLWMQKAIDTNFANSAQLEG